MKYFLDTEFHEDGKRLKQTGEHHALEDARWNKRMYYFLTDTVPPPDPAMRSACLEAFDRDIFNGYKKRNWRRVKEIAHALVLILAAILFWVAVAAFQYYGR